MRIKGVIFDLDGTLLNTLDDIADAMNATLSSENFPVHPVEAYKYFVGDGTEKLIRRTVPQDVRDNDEIFNKLHIRFHDEYAAHLNKKTCLYHEIADMLDAISGRNIKMAILSNKPHDLTLKTVQHYLNKWKFAAVYGAREGYPRKPHPATAVMISEEIGLDPGDFIYLGDTKTDMLTAQGASMFPVGALWGFRDNEELLFNGAMYLLETPLEILDLLE